MENEIEAKKTAVAVADTGMDRLIHARSYGNETLEDISLMLTLLFSK